MSIHEFFRTNTASKPRQTFEEALASFASAFGLDPASPVLTEARTLIRDVGDDHLLPSDVAVKRLLGRGSVFGSYTPFLGGYYESIPMAEVGTSRAAYEIRSLGFGLIEAVCGDIRNRRFVGLPKQATLATRRSSASLKPWTHNGVNYDTFARYVDTDILRETPAGKKWMDPGLRFRSRLSADLAVGYRRWVGGTGTGRVMGTMSDLASESVVNLFTSLRPTNHLMRNDRNHRLDPTAAASMQWQKERDVVLPSAIVERLEDGDGVVAFLDAGDAHAKRFIVEMARITLALAGEYTDALAERFTDALAEADRQLQAADGAGFAALEGVVLG